MRRKIRENPETNVRSRENDGVKRSGGEEIPGRTVEDTFLGEDPLQSFRRIAPPSAAAREPETLLCRHLRTSVWSLAHPAIGGFAPTEPYCCSKTLRCVGPGGVPVLPDECTEGRGCFEPAYRLREPES
jgi:hypothetical protein